MRVSEPLWGEGGWGVGHAWTVLGLASYPCRLGTRLALDMSTVNPLPFLSYLKR